jgi:tetratricopeptide (TPR) repeat protein
MKAVYRLIFSFLVIFMIGVLLPLDNIFERLLINAAGINAMSIFHRNEHEAQPLKFIDSKLFEGICEVDWINSIIAHNKSMYTKRDEYWDKIIDCAPQLFPFVYDIVPDNYNWALRSVHEVPQYSSSWFWLANLTEENQKDYAIRAYQKGLELEPWDVKQRLKLARLLVEKSPSEALEEFRVVCCGGDIGNHGCLNAGLMAEQLGDFSRAMRFYYSSDQEYIIAKGSELEKVYGKDKYALIFKIWCP